MREFKFRAWDKIEQKMFEVDKLQYDFGWQITGYFGEKDDYNHHSPIENKEVVLMQWTGLKDKNGKDIYEGDIIEVPDAYPTSNDVFICEVKYISSGYYIIFEDKVFGKRLMEENINYEVVGNIYENPELIKKVEE